METSVKFIVEVESVIGANDSEKDVTRKDTESVIIEKKALFNSLFNHLFRLKNMGVSSCLTEYSSQINGKICIYGKHLTKPIAYLKEVDEKNYVICVCGTSVIDTNIEFSLDTRINILSLRNICSMTEKYLYFKMTEFNKIKKEERAKKKELMFDLIKGSDKLTLNVSSMNKRKQDATETFEKEIAEIERIKNDYITEYAKIFGGDNESKEIFTELLNSMFV